MMPLDAPVPGFRPFELQRQINFLESDNAKLREQVHTLQAQKRADDQALQEMRKRVAYWTARAQRVEEGRPIRGPKAEA